MKKKYNLGGDVYIPNKEELKSRRFKDSWGYDAINLFNTTRRVTNAVGGAALNAVAPGLGTAAQNVSNQVDKTLFTSIAPDYMQKPLDERMARTENRWLGTLEKGLNISGNFMSTVGNTSGVSNSSILPNTPSVDSVDYQQQNPYEFQENPNSWYANTGGDLPINNSAFKVRGNPNVTDGNNYQAGNMNISLDHNEIVKNNFVFSDSLMRTKKQSFADVATDIEKSTGKAEKKITKNPYDEFSHNTIKANEVRSNYLAKEQETFATAKGHRNPDGSTKQAMNYGGTINMQTGGPGDGRIQPNAGTTFIKLNNSYFYDPYQQRFLKRDITGAYYKTKAPENFSIDNTGNVVNNGKRVTDIDSHRLYDSKYTMAPGKYTSLPSPNNGMFGDRIMYNNITGEFVKGQQDNIFRNPTNLEVLSDRTMPTYTNGRIKVTDEKGSYYKDNNIPVFNKSGDLITYDGYWDGGGSREFIDPKTGKTVNQQPIQPVSSSSSATNREINLGKIPSTFEDLLGTVQQSSQASVTPQGKTKVGGKAKTITNSTSAIKNIPQPRGGQDVVPNIGWGMSEANLSNAVNTNSDYENPYLGTDVGDYIADKTRSSLANRMEVNTVGTVDKNPPFTTGDYVQMGSLAGKIGLAFRPQDRQNLYTDDTPISKASFDPSSQLSQSQRNFSNAYNNIGASSINTHRAVANSMLANKLSADQQIISQYDQLNRNALLDYENRLSNQKRYNIGNRYQTDDWNQRNKDARLNAINSAFDSMTNFGIQLNEKKQGQKVIDLYKESYGDVFDRFERILFDKDKQKTT